MNTIESKLDRIIEILETAFPASCTSEAGKIVLGHANVETFDTSLERPEVEVYLGAGMEPFFYKRLQRHLRREEIIRFTVTFAE